MLNRLNGWQRIGVVISALWLAFIILLAIGSAYSNGPFGERIEATYETVRTEAVCSKSASPAPGQKEFTIDEAFGCAPGAMISAPSEKKVLVSPAQRQFYFAFFLVALVAPVLLFWLLSYGSVAIFRWVAQGFRRAT